MTDTLAPRTDQAVFFDHIGNPLDWSANLAYESDEAIRYLNFLQRGKENRSLFRLPDIFANHQRDYERPPGSILGMIAVFGKPDLANYAIRLNGWYGHVDDAVYHDALTQYLEADLIMLTRLGRRSDAQRNLQVLDNHYDLTDFAQTTIPTLREIRWRVQQAYI